MARRCQRTVVAGLMKDADAMTATFVVVAHPFPLDRPECLHEMRVRELAQTHDRLLQQTQELAQRADGLDAGYGDLKRLSMARSGRWTASRQTCSG